MKDKAMTQDDVADWLTLPLQMHRGDREMYVPVRFFRRKDDGATEHVYTAGVSPAVPITYLYDGIDWDMNRTFANPSVTLYADWDEWLAYLRDGDDEEGD